jgi:hypothetical protein
MAMAMAMAMAKANFFPLFLFAVSFCFQELSPENLEFIAYLSGIV